MKLIDVAVPVPVFQTYTYSVPTSIQAEVCTGARVLVPFGTRHMIGMVMGETYDYGDRSKLKQIINLLDTKALLSPSLLELARWLSWYYVSPVGECLRIMLPPGLLAKKASPDEAPERFWPARRQRAIVSVIELECPLTARQAELLRLLRRQKLPVLQSHILRETGYNQATLRGLHAKGFVQIKDIDIYRSPWSEILVDNQSPHVLNEEQKRVLKAVREKVDKLSFSTLLLHGVTASGKTEVYLNAISHVAEDGRTALVLVPEIGLTPQISRQFRSWFGDRVAILHSALSEGERFDQWRRIRGGKASVVVGTRSAVFAPLPNLGLIVVDEEHDSSYKQGDRPRYNGRDTAIKRGQIEGVPVLLGSATPQLETYYNSVNRGQTGYLPLRSRIHQRPLPSVHIVDMRSEFERLGKATVLSEDLVKRVSKRLRRGEQVLMLLNRRGYAAILLCRSCGHTETCAHCSISLTYHQEFNRLNCHYCGYSRSVPPNCPQCKKPYIYFVGEGTEKIEEIVKEMFPDASVDRLDRDTVQRKGSHDRILGDFAKGKTDILVGTQMIAKGHDFPSVTLVGVLSADQGLRLSDFRAAERTFQLLTQVAGRAGRGRQPGEVVIQTYFPNHYSLKYACSQDYVQFAERELEFRRRFSFPPFTALAGLLVQKKDSRKAWALSHLLVERLLEHRKRVSSSSRLRILGPAPAAIERIKAKHRVQVLIRATDRKALHDVLESTLKDLMEQKVNLKDVSVDIDPINLM